MIDKTKLKPQNRFQSKSVRVDIGMNSIMIIFSAVIMIGGSLTDFRQFWPVVVLNSMYITGFVLIILYSFTRSLSSRNFFIATLWLLTGTIVLRELLFPPELANFAIEKICQAFAIAMILCINRFDHYWPKPNIAKRLMWAMIILDMLIAVLYNLDLFLFEKTSEFDSFYIQVEIWIRPLISYCVLRCYLTRMKEKGLQDD